MRRRLLGGLIGIGLAVALPGVAMAQGGGPPTSVWGTCWTTTDGRGAIPIPSDDVTGGRAPSVWFGSEVIGPLGIAPVFGRTGGCEFTEPAT